jgi:hypothetical protein
MKMTLAIVLLLCGALVLSGCSGGGEEEPATPATEQDAAAPTDEPMPGPPAPPTGAESGAETLAPAEGADEDIPAADDPAAAVPAADTGTDFGTPTEPAGDAFGTPEPQPVEPDPQFGERVAGPASGDSDPFGAPADEQDAFGAGSPAPADDSAPARTVTGALGKALFQGITGQ